MEALFVAILGLVFAALELRSGRRREREAADEPRPLPSHAPPKAARAETRRRRETDREMKNHERRLAALRKVRRAAAKSGSLDELRHAEAMMAAEMGRHTEKMRRLAG